MSYSNPKSVTYSRTIGVANATWAVTPPPGCTQCRVQSINASPTTTYNAVTTSAKVQVGVANNLAVGGALDIGTTAAGSAAGFSVNKGVNPLIPLLDVSGTAAAATVSTAQAAIVANGPVLITFVANTGGTPAGAGSIDVTLDWF